MNSTVKSIIYALIIMLNSFQYGYIFNYPAPASKEIHERFGMADSDMRWSLYNSVICVGALIITFLIPKIIKLFKNSRKKLTIAVDIHIIIFLCVNLSLTKNIYAGIVARFFLGLGIGITSYLTPMYLVEMAPAQYSSAFGSMQELGINIGSIVLCFVGGVVSVTYLTVVAIAQSVLALILILFVPESPAAHEESIENNQTIAEKPVSIFQKKYLKRILISGFAVLSQQFCGISVVTTNLTDILSSSGLDMNPNFQAGIGTCAQFISVVIGSFLMDKFGIKKMWVASFSCMFVALLIFSIHEKLKLATWVPLFCVFLYQLTYGIGAGPIPWFVGPRYLPDSVRPQGAIINGAMNYSFCTLLTLVFPLMRKTMTMFGLFLFYSICSLIISIVGAIIIYEPKSREEVNREDAEDTQIKEEESDNSDKTQQEIEAIQEL